MENAPTAQAPRVPRGASRVAVLAAICGPVLHAVGASVCAGVLAQAAHAAEPVPPAMLRAAVPDYPAQARRNGSEGTVHVRARVLADGQPSEVRVQRSSGVRALDEAAVAAVNRSRFRAAQNAEGVSVEAWVIVPFKFVLEDEPQDEVTRRPVLHPAAEAP